MPHRRDVEAAADVHGFRYVGEVQGHEQDVWDTLGSLALEMVFGHPECGVAEVVHCCGDGLGFRQCGGKVGVVVEPVVDGGAGVADVFDVYMAGEQAVEFGDHGSCSSAFAAIVRRLAGLASFGGVRSGRAGGPAVDDRHAIRLSGPQYKSDTGFVMGRTAGG